MLYFKVFILEEVRDRHAGVRMTDIELLPVYGERPGAVVVDKIPT